MDLLNLANQDERKTCNYYSSQVRCGLQRGGAADGVQRPVSEVARSLGIGENIIYRWKSRHKARENKGKEQALAAPDYQALHKRILELEAERDIFKKALAIFSRQT